MGLVLRYQPEDFGGTAGCSHHTTLLQVIHPGSAIVPIQESIETMNTFNGHPDLVALDEDHDTRD
ncbi:hypothetical protein [Streptomyces corynorhini]|uniref:Uncharacterized protein n=1 Tax=Streptomyces corynorhini TaxID=2282652 RepID=A0A370BDQ7_9ACTN|nr:hypothetical protein [Streptomyces corynorhini]RDG37943.1 hypothetical protein DVH02_11510 [Streptomyces corynorhini]